MSNRSKRRRYFLARLSNINSCGLKIHAEKKKKSVSSSSSGYSIPTSSRD